MIDSVIALGSALWENYRTMKNADAPVATSQEASSVVGANPQSNTPSLHGLLTPPFIPDHELLRKIGGGSYGEVWLAKNAVGTLRAVKIVHRQTFERGEHFEREFKGLQTFEPLSR